MAMAWFLMRTSFASGWLYGASLTTSGLALAAVIHAALFEGMILDAKNRVVFVQQMLLQLYGL